MNDFIQNELAQKYEEYVEGLFNIFVKNSVKKISEIEKRFQDEELKVKLEKSSLPEKSDINVFFDSLYNANSMSSYSLAVTKISNFLQSIKLYRNNENNIAAKEIDYLALENSIKGYIKSFVNSFHLNDAYFDYEIAYKELKKEQEKFSEKEENFLNLNYLHRLLDAVLQYLPTLNTVVEKYSLLSVQNVAFSKYQYSAISDSFIKKEYTKNYKIDLKKMYELFSNIKNLDIDDVFSEDYNLYTMLILEVSYFLCNYFIDTKTSIKQISKDENAFRENIKSNIMYYLDKILYDNPDVFLEAYPKILNEVNNYNYDEMLFSLLKIAEK